MMRILVGLSGGVDSAVAAYLLKQQGHDVVAGFMKNYVSDTGNCTTYDDAEEAIKVATFLGIEILAFDLQKEYQERIIDYIFEGYKRGVTPNPDVLCNSLIKFDVFLEKALAQGFDKIAMGHYATIEQVGDMYHLIRGVDYNKDQTYFLAGLNQFQLSKSIFPLGVLKKEKVRTIAREIGLPNAARKDSQGLCFIGNVPIKTFLMQRFSKKTGDIKTLDGKVVGQHDGAYFFTIGQKQGLGLNFKAYVYRIDVENNIVYVGDKDIEELQTKQIIVKDWHRIAEEYLIGSQLLGKIRYRQNPLAVSKIIDLQNNEITVEFNTPQRAVAPGQVFVLYDGEICVGSGIIG
ncbi:MAG: tRNA 2-thiouridine(34) synthase MnmA [Candidatus Absconditabacteria bacterium]